MMKIKDKICIILLSIFICIMLTLNIYPSTSKNIFEISFISFFLFFAVLLAFWNIHKYIINKTKKIKLTKQEIIIAIVVSVIVSNVIVISSLQNNFLKDSIVVSTLKSKENRVYIDSIKLDNKNIDLATLSNEEWIYDKNKGMLYTTNENSILSIDCYNNKSFELNISKKYSDADIQIEYKNKKNIYNINSNSKHDLNYMIDLTALSFSLSNLFIYFLTLFLNIYIILSILKFIKFDYEKYFKYLIIYISLILGLFIKSFDMISSLIILLLMIYIGYKFPKFKNSKEMKKYYKLYNIIIITIVSLYASFATIGTDEILKNIFNYCNLICGFSKIILLMFIYLILSYVLIYYYECISKALHSNKKKNNVITSTNEYEKENKKTFKICAILVSLIITILSVMFLDNYIIYKYKDTTLEITATSKNGKLNVDNEIYINRIATDSGNLDLTNSKLSNNWDYIGETSMVYHYSNVESTQTIHVPKSRNVKIYFAMYNLGGIAKIKDGNKITTIDLSSDDNSYIKNNYIYNVESNILQQNLAIMITKYILLFVVIFAICLLFSRLIFNQKRKIYSDLEMMNNRKSFVILFIINFIMLTISAIAFYPGNYSWDNLYQHQQAMAMSQVSNGHPIVMVTFMKILLKIMPSAFFITMVIITLYSLVLATCQNYFKEKGIKLKYIIIFAIIFNLLPNNYMMYTGFLKDIPQAFCILLLSFFITKIITNNKKFSSNLIYLILLPVSLSLIILLRNEGLIIYYICLIILIVYCILKKNIKIIISLISSVLIIYIVNGPITTILNANDENVLSGSYMFLAKGMTSVAVHNKNLSEETIKYLETGQPLYKWKARYNAYNSDSFGGDFDTSNMKNYSILYGLKLYLKEFINNPGYILKDKLMNMDTLWNIRVNDEYVPFNYYDGVMTFYMVGPKEFGLQSNNGEWKANNFISNIYREIRTFFESNEIFKMLFWKTGIYIYILLVLCIYALNKYKKSLFILLPIIIKTLVWFMILCYQHYRYVYYVFLLTPFLIIFVILANKELGDVYHEK